MYSSVIPLKGLTLKVNCRAYLYHKVTDYDHVIAYARLSFLVIDMKAMINYLDARKFRLAKSHFDVTRRAVHTSGCTILYLIIPHIVPIMFILFSLHCAFGRYDIPQIC